MLCASLNFSFMLLLWAWFYSLVHKPIDPSSSLGFIKFFCFLSHGISPDHLLVPSTWLKYALPGSISYGHLKCMAHPLVWSWSSHDLSIDLWCIHGIVYSRFHSWIFVLVLFKLQVLIQVISIQIIKFMFEFIHYNIKFVQDSNFIQIQVLYPFKVNSFKFTKTLFQ